MPILNYTTKIAPEKSVMEIQKLLAKHGAKQIGVDIDEDGDPAGVSFTIEVRGTLVHYRLPADWRGVHAALSKQRVAAQFKSEYHALRVSWRIVKDWLEAQLAIIESGQAKLEQIMLPYTVASDGRTLFEHFEASPHLLLGE